MCVYFFFFAFLFFVLFILLCAVCTLGPFLRSATDSDFPRPVRSVRRQRLATAAFVQSKPVNWARFLQKMFMFPNGDSSNDVSNVLIHTYWFLHVRHHVCSWSLLTKYVENAAARSGWRFKWEDQDDGVIWWKICWHVFLRGELRKKINSTLSRNSCLTERKRPGWGEYYEQASKKVSWKLYRLDQSGLC